MKKIGRRRFLFAMIPMIFVFRSTEMSNAAEASFRPAGEITKEIGILKPTSILNWRSSEKLPRNWSRLENLFFQIDYLTCFDVDTIGEEADPKKSLVIVLQRSAKCIKSDDAISFIEVLRPINQISSLENVARDNMVYRQRLTLNGTDTVLMAALTSGPKLRDGIPEKGVPEYTVHWRVVLKCSGETFELNANQEGKKAAERIQSRTFKPPQEFQEIVSTFKCAKNPPRIDSLQ